MNPPIIVVLSVLVAGADSPAVGAAQARQAVRTAGGQITGLSIDHLYDGQAETFDVADVQGQLTTWRAAVKRATDLYYAQRFGKAAKAFRRALGDDFTLPHPVAAKVRAKFPREWVEASLQAKRAYDEVGPGKDEGGRAVLHAIGRHPTIDLPADRFPAALRQWFQIAKDTLRADRRTGAVDVEVQAATKPETCRVSVGDWLYGYAPARIPAVPTGRHSVTALCASDDGRTLVRSRPVWVTVLDARESLTLVVGGDRQLVERSAGVGVLAAPGWSEESDDVELAARAAMARTGANGAVVVGPDPAVGSGLVTLRFGERLDTPAPAMKAKDKGSAWLWWVAGGLLGAGTVTGGYAWSAHREFEDCKGDRACGPRLAGLADRVDGRAMTADVLLGAGVVAAGLAAVLHWTAK